MPIIKSAKKRVRVAKKATIRNRHTKRSVKNTVKALQDALGSKSKSTDAQKKAQSELDKAVKKGVISKNKAARKKSQLAKTVKSIATEKTTKTAAKKTAAKKTTAKKN